MTAAETVCDPAERAEFEAWLQANPPLIHVGLHKCASTWLQRLVFGNPDLGFATPWGAMSAIAVSEFVAIDPLAFDAAAVRACFVEAAQPGRSGGLPVISHEALSSRPHHGAYCAPQVAERLAAVFPGARILLIFREQRAIIRSLHVEHVRNGGRSTLREFIGTGDEPDGWTSIIQLSFFEYDRLIGMYRDIFGADAVLALPLELLRRDPDDFRRRLFTFAGLPDAPVDAERQINTAWSPALTEFYRRTNGLVRNNPLAPTHPLTFRIRQKLVWNLSRRFPARSDSRAVARDKAMIAARVGDHFADSNARTAALTGLDLGALGYPVRGAGSAA